MNSSRKGIELALDVLRPEAALRRSLSKSRHLANEDVRAEMTEAADALAEVVAELEAAIGVVYVPPCKCGLPREHERHIAGHEFRHEYRAER